MRKALFDHKNTDHIYNLDCYDSYHCYDSKYFNADLNTMYVGIKIGPAFRKMAIGYHSDNIFCTCRDLDFIELFNALVDLRGEIEGQER